MHSVAAWQGQGVGVAGGLLSAPTSVPPPHLPRSWREGGQQQGLTEPTWDISVGTERVLAYDAWQAGRCHRMARRLWRCKGHSYLSGQWPSCNCHCNCLCHQPHTHITTRIHNAWPPCQPSHAPVSGTRETHDISRSLTPCPASPFHRYTVIPRVLYVRRWGMKRWGLAFGKSGRVTYN